MRNVWFFRKLGKMLQNLSSDAVVIVGLRFKKDKNKKYENESYFKIQMQAFNSS